MAGELEEREDAIVAWRSVLDDFGPTGPVLGSLVDLYEGAELWAELAETVETWLDLSEDDDERIELLSSLGPAICATTVRT